MRIVASKCEGQKLTETGKEIIERIRSGTIREPGVYQDFPEDAYHADPLPEPSASRSIIQTIAERTPRHAFIAHPRLDPAFERTEDDKFSMGTAGHKAILSRGKGIAVGDFKDYRTDAAKAWRTASKGAGLVPILQEQAERVANLRAAVIEQLPDHGLEHLFNPDLGRAEVVAAWIDPVAGWSRLMADWLEADLTITDIKITGVDDFTPAGLGRHMSGMGYEFIHAWYERGIVNLFPEMEGRFKYRFLFVEEKAPHAIMPIILPNDAIAKGRMMVEMGAERWAEAKRTGQWPRYKGGDVVADYPPWSVAEFAK